MKCEINLGTDGIVNITQCNEVSNLYCVKRDGFDNYYTIGRFSAGDNEYKIDLIDGRVAVSRAEIVWHLITVKELS